MSANPLNPQTDHKFLMHTPPAIACRSEKATKNQELIELVKRILNDATSLQDPDVNACISILHKQMLNPKKNESFDLTSPLNELCKKIILITKANQDENAFALISQIQPLIRKPLQRLFIVLNENPTFKNLDSLYLPKNTNTALHFCSEFDKVIRGLSPYYESMKGDNLHTELMAILTPIANAIYTLYINGNQLVSASAKQSIKLLAKKELIPQEHKKALFRFADEKQQHYDSFYDDCSRIIDFFNKPPDQDKISKALQSPFLKQCMNVLHSLANLVPNEESYEMEALHYFPSACSKLTDDPINLPQTLADLIDSIYNQINEYQSEISEYDNSEIIHQTLHSYQAALTNIKAEIEPSADFTDPENLHRYQEQMFNIRSVLSLLQTCKIRRSLFVLQECHQGSIPQKMHLAVYNEFAEIDNEFIVTLTNSNVIHPSDVILKYANLYYDQYLSIISKLPILPPQTFDLRLSMTLLGFQDHTFLLDCMRAKIPIDQLQCSINFLQLAGMDIKNLLNNNHDEESIWFFKTFCNRAMLSQVSNSEQYGNHPTSRHQRILLQKYSDYISLKNTQEELPRELWNVNGLCNGINFLKGFYDALEPDGWNIRFDLFADWNGSIEALQAIGPTFANGESYETIEAFFEYFLNGLTLFQFTVDEAITHSLMSPNDTIIESQFNRPLQLEIIARENPTLSLKNFELSPIKNLTPQEFIEELTILTQKDSGTVIEIAGGSHATRIEILEDGFKYYDCNLEYNIPIVTSIEELANIIFYTKYAANQKINDGKIEFLTCSYILVNSDTSE